MIVADVVAIGWSPDGTHTGTPTPAPEMREFCAHCWGSGKIHEMANGRMQFPAVPCDECFGTGQSWREGAAS